MTRPLSVALHLSNVYQILADERYFERAVNNMSQELHETIFHSLKGWRKHWSQNYFGMNAATLKLFASLQRQQRWQHTLGLTPQTPPQQQQPLSPYRIKRYKIYKSSSFTKEAILKKALALLSTNTTFQTLSSSFSSTWEMSYAKADCRMRDTCHTSCNSTF